MTVGLKPWQNVILPGVLYRAHAKRYTAPKFADSSDAQLAPTIEINGADAVDIYTSQIYPDAAPAGMNPIGSATGIVQVDVVPNFFYLAPTGAAPDSIVLSGIAATAVMQMVSRNWIILPKKANLTLIPPQALLARHQVPVYNKANLVLV